MFRKILYVGYDGFGPMYSWIDNNIILELRNKGVLVEKISVCRTFTPEHVHDRVLKSIKEFKPDLFFSALDDRTTKRSLKELISNLNIAKVLFCCDNLSVPHNHKRSCQLYDLVWLTSNETINLFKKWNAKTIMLPYAANSEFYKTFNCNELDGDIVFVGTLYGSRLMNANFLARNDIKVKIYGETKHGGNPLFMLQENTLDKFRNISNLLKFPIGRKALKASMLKILHKSDSSIEKNIEFIGNNITYENLCKVYSRSKISLNITELWNTYLLKKPIHKLHLRTFEIPACGGLQLAFRTKELLEYYKEDQEIILYSSPEELIDKAKFYSKDENLALREQIKRNARNRTMYDHSWERRFETIYNALKNGS